MKKISKRQKAYQVRRREGVNKRRVRSRDKRKEGRLRQISGTNA